jgi:hypothetical protein
VFTVRVLPELQAALDAMPRFVKGLSGASEREQAANVARMLRRLSTCILEEAGTNCAEWRPSNSCSVAL